MITVTYGDKEFTCATAYKGADYVRLVDEAGCRVASFEGVVDFSLFTIDGGEWSEEPSCDDCYIAVVMPDGTLAPSTHKCNSLTRVFFGSTVIDFAYMLEDGREHDPKEEFITYMLGKEDWYHHSFELPPEVVDLIKSGMHAYVTLINPIADVIGAGGGMLDNIAEQFQAFSRYASKHFTGALIYTGTIYDNATGELLETPLCSLTFDKNLLDVYQLTDWDMEKQEEVPVERYRAYYAITCVSSDYAFPAYYP